MNHPNPRPRKSSRKASQNAQPQDVQRPRASLRRYTAQGVAVVGMLGLAGVGMAFSPSTPKLNPLSPGFGLEVGVGAPALQQEASDARAGEDVIEGALYSRVMRVRQGIAMSNDDLAALGLTEAQAEDVLTRLVEWVELNQAAMIQADNAAESAKKELAALERLIRVGLADDRELATLADVRQRVAEATAACEALDQQAGTHAIAPAPGNIRSQWQAARTYRALPLDMRHLPGLDQRRVEDLMDAMSRQATSQGANALPLSSVRAMDEVRARVQAHSTGVAAAEARVLPVPVEMRDDEAGMFLDGEEEE